MSIDDITQKGRAGCRVVSISGSYGTGLLLHVFGLMGLTISKSQHAVSSDKRAARGRRTALGGAAVINLSTGRRRALFRVFFILGLALVYARGVLTDYIRGHLWIFMGVDNCLERRW